MTELETQVLEEIRRLAEAELGHAGVVEPWQLLREDLALDSMSTLVMAVGLEDRFRVRLEEQDAGTLLTVGDLMALVCRRIAEQGGREGTGT